MIRVGLLVQLIGCSSAGPGAPITVTGFLVALNNADTPKIPASATVTVLGRDEQEFPVKFDASNPGKFEMKNLPNDEVLTFQVSGPQIDTTISLPQQVNGSKSLNLPILPQGTRDFFIEQVRIKYLKSQDIDKGKKAMLFGAFAPGGGGCAPIRGVDLVSKADGTSVLSQNTNGPFYVSGNQVVTGRMNDDECSYLIFNILPGAYKLTALGSNPLLTAEVLALPGKVIVGYGLPG